MILWPVVVTTPAATSMASSAAHASVSPALTASAVAAVVAYLVAAFTNAGALTRFSVPAMALAWAAHGASLALDILGPGEGARFGFAPALSFTLWLVVAAHLFEQRLHAMPAARRAVCILGAAAVALAWFFPGETRVAEAPWAPLHWLLGLVSYGLIGAAVVHAWLLGRAERRLRGPSAVARVSSGAAPAGGMPLMTIERLTFRFVDAGFVVLTLAVALGIWFAVQGHGWRWDHKTVFSLLGWIVMASLVAGRHRWGWRGRRATRWIYVGAVLLLLAYVGSRFVFAVLLGRPY